LKFLLDRWLSTIPRHQ
jgi:hypothetical protein